MHIEHLAFTFEEPSKAAEWYGKQLGFKVLRKLNVAADTHFLVDAAGHVVIEIYNNPMVKVPNYAAMHPLTLHVAFHCEDVPATYDRLIEAGASCVDEPSVSVDGDHFAMLRDPWGLALQLVRRAKSLHD